MSNKLSLEMCLGALLADLENYSASLEVGKNSKLDIFVTLESRTKKICDDIISLSGEERKHFRPLIDNVLQKSENLKNLLVKKKTLIEEQINSLNVSAKATKAYKQHATK